MRRAFLITPALLLTFSSWTVSSQTAATEEQGLQTSYSYYVYNGKSLEIANGDPTTANYTEWQVWLNPNGLPVSRTGSGLAYVRWGVIAGPSAGAVTKQLTTYQEFERAYTSFFGANSWGRLTFSYPVGPIAIAKQPPTDDPYDARMNIDLLNQKLEPVVNELRASLVNGQGNVAPSLVQQYFEQVRDSMQSVARFYDKMSRLPAAHHYLSQELALLTPGVEQAETVDAKVTAILPTVRLPDSKNWMAHTEFAGRDGTIHVTVKEIGSTAWVEQTWTDGDGSMTGTKIISIVPFQEIGALYIQTQEWGRDRRWILRIEPVRPNAFPESVTSPKRITPRRTYPAVDLKTACQSVYLDFSNSRDAQDAYAFFLFHKERGT